VLAPVYRRFTERAGRSSGLAPLRIRWT
jgi:hypothetical protein